ncbi:hypothetical protein FZW96_02415 [Bacillus sp. BGMRC 2118]|nr:hypothetical protein FZW96_02415 [Bacillus sp. BGMRC 2118]
MKKMILLIFMFFLMWHFGNYSVFAKGDHRDQVSEKVKQDEKNFKEGTFKVIDSITVNGLIEETYEVEVPYNGELEFNEELKNEVNAVSDKLIKIIEGVEETASIKNKEEIKEGITELLHSESEMTVKETKIKEQKGKIVAFFVEFESVKGDFVKSHHYQTYYLDMNSGAFLQERQVLNNEEIQEFKDKYSKLAGKKEMKPSTTVIFMSLLSLILIVPAFIVFGWSRSQYSYSQNHHNDFRI